MFTTANLPTNDQIQAAAIQAAANLRNSMCPYAGELAAIYRETLNVLRVPTTNYAGKKAALKAIESQLQAACRTAHANLPKGETFLAQCLGL